VEERGRSHRPRAMQSRERERPARRAARTGIHRLEGRIVTGETGVEGYAYQKRPAKRVARTGRDRRGGRH